MPKSTKSRRVLSREITCKKATSLIADYLSEKLDPEIALAFEEHLSICPDCVAFLNTYKQTIQAIQSFYKKMPAKKMSKGTAESLKEKIRNRTIR